VIAFDQQGHGRTADLDRPFSFEGSAADAVALLAELGVERADWLGYSNGGHVALQAALGHPERIRRLVVESAMFDREGAPAAFWSGFDDARLEQMPAELREAYLAVAPRPQDLPTFFAKSVARMRAFRGFTPEQLRSIAAPALVLAGDRDVLTAEHAVRMFRLLGDAQLAILPGVDHMSIVRRADWVAPIVEAFLGGR
jgi:pimeloyl-ACP methyl ester carboxylesterase